MTDRKKYENEMKEVTEKLKFYNLSKKDLEVMLELYRSLNQSYEEWYKTRARELLLSEFEGTAANLALSLLSTGPVGLGLSGGLALAGLVDLIQFKEEAYNKKLGSGSMFDNLNPIFLLNQRYNETIQIINEERGFGIEEYENQLRMDLEEQLKLQYGEYWEGASHLIDQRLATASNELAWKVVSERYPKLASRVSQSYDYTQNMKPIQTSLENIYNNPDEYSALHDKLFSENNFNKFLGNTMFRDDFIIGYSMSRDEDAFKVFMERTGDQTTTKSYSEEEIEALIERWGSWERVLNQVMSHEESYNWWPPEKQKQFIKDLKEHDEYWRKRLIKQGGYDWLKKDKKINDPISFNLDRFKTSSENVNNGIRMRDGWLLPFPDEKSGGEFSWIDDEYGADGEKRCYKSSIPGVNNSTVNDIMSTSVGGSADPLGFLGELSGRIGDIIAESVGYLDQFLSSGALMEPLEKAEQQILGIGFTFNQAEESASRFAFTISNDVEPAVNNLSMLTGEASEGAEEASDQIAKSSEAMGDGLSNSGEEAKSFSEQLSEAAYWGSQIANAFVGVDQNIARWGMN